MSAANSMSAGTGKLICFVCRFRRELRDQEHPMSRTRFINPQTLSKPPGYTQVVEAVC